MAEKKIWIAVAGKGLVEGTADIVKPGQATWQPTGSGLKKTNGEINHSDLVGLTASMIQGHKGVIVGRVYSVGDQYLCVIANGGIYDVDFGPKTWANRPAGLKKGDTVAINGLWTRIGMITKYRRYMSSRTRWAEVPANGDGE